MKNLQNLKGAHLLSKQEQQSINGGGEGSLCIDECMAGGSCGSGSSCVIFSCFGSGELYGLCVSDEK